MKSITIVNGSRNKKGNTQKFISQILANLKSNEWSYDWIFPQDYKILPIYETFTQQYDENSDDMGKIQKKILNSDLLIIASPVYIHSMSSDLKLIIERISSWAHTLMLQGKPVVVLSTCESNGFDKVIRPLSELMTYMGGNVIATSNASLINEFNNPKRLNEIAIEISNRMENYTNYPPQSNKFMEKNFLTMKSIIQERIKQRKLDKQSLDSEENHWVSENMLKYDTFSSFLENKYLHNQKSSR